MDGKWIRLGIRANVIGFLILSSFLTASFSGCMSLPAQIMWVLKGHDVGPAYDGLKKKTVAILCISEGSTLGPNSSAEMLSKKLAADLSQHLKKGVQLVPHAQVEAWLDTNGWENQEPVQMGRDLGADRVLVVEIDSYSLHQGGTILKGRCNSTSTIYDIENGGTVAFSTASVPFEWPGSGFASLQMSDREFESLYLTKLATFVGQNFYKHDRTLAAKSKSNFN